MISTRLRWSCRCSGSCLKCEEPPKTDSCFMSIWDTWRWNQQTKLISMTKNLCNQIRWTEPYFQEKSLKERRRIKEGKQRKIVIWWGYGPFFTNINGQVLEVEEFGRQHWCIDRLHNKHGMSQINKQGMTPVLWCVYIYLYSTTRLKVSDHTSPLVLISRVSTLGTMDVSSARA